MSGVWIDGGPDHRERGYEREYLTELRAAWPEWDDDDPSLRVPVVCVPRSRDFDQRRRLGTGIPNNERRFGHESVVELYASPRQLWTQRCDYYEPVVRIWCIELVWPVGYIGPGASIRVFRAGPGRPGQRAADLVRVENLDWTCDRCVQTYFFTGNDELQCISPEQSFGLRNCAGGSRILYVVEPGDVRNQEPGSSLLDCNCVGRPVPFLRIRILYSVPYSKLGRDRYRI